MLNGFGVAGKIRRNTEAAEGLAEQADPLEAEVLAERLGVADDRVGAEVPQAGGVGGRVQVGGAVRRGQAGAAMVEHQHPVVAQGALQPSR